MLRKLDEPLYRPVLREAFATAWREKRFWWVALLAGMIMTGSLYDVLWKGLNSLAPQGSVSATFAGLWGNAVTAWGGLSITDTVIGAIDVFLLSSFSIIMAVAVFGIASIAQGALVYGLGHMRRARPPRVKDSLTVGARAVWPIMVLNIFALSVLWAMRALIAIALSFTVSDTTAASYLLYLAAFVAFIALAGATVIVQIFALNAMILQGATLAQAIERGVMVFRRHWVISVETAAILFVISVGAWILTVALNMLMSVPLFMIAMIAVFLNSGLLFWATLYIGILLFFAIMLAIAGFVIELHYATWVILWKRLGEGGVLPKVHRWFRSLLGIAHVPGT
jgi:hypothetical protein